MSKKKNNAQGNNSEDSGMWNISNIISKIGGNVKKSVSANLINRSLTSVVENATDYLLIWDKNLNLLYFKHNELKSDLVKIDRITGQRINVPMKHLPSLIEQWRSKALLVFKTGKKDYMHHKVNVDNRMIFGVAEFIPIVNEKNETYAVGVLYTDVSHEKSIIDERNFNQYILDTAINPTLILSADGQISYVNHNLIKLWEYPSPEALFNQNIRCLHKDQVKTDVLLENLRKFGSTSEEITAIKKDGNLFDVKITGAKISDRRGEQELYIISYIDIGRYKAIEKELVKVTKEHKDLTERKAKLESELNSRDRQLHKKEGETTKKLKELSDAKLNLETKLKSIKKEHEEIVDSFTIEKSQRIQAEKEIDTFFGLVNSLLNSIKHDAFIVDGNDKILYENDFALKSLNLKSHEVKNKDIKTLYPGVFKTGIDKLMQSKGNEATVSSSESNGQKEFHYMIHSIEIPGNLSGYVVIIREVPIAEREFHKYQYYKALIDKVDNPVFVTDENVLKFEYINHSMEKLFELKSTDNKTFDLSKILDKSSLETLKAKIKSLEVDDTFSEIDIEWQYPSEENIETSLLCRKFQSSENVKYLFLIKDKTNYPEIKNAEELFYKLSDYSDTCSAILDLSGKISSANTTLLRTLGIEKQEDIIGKSFSVIGGNEVILKKLVNQKVKQSKASEEFTYNNKKTSQKLYLYAEYTLVNDEKENPGFISVRFWDRTEEKKYQDKINQLSLKLNEYESSSKSTNTQSAKLFLELLNSYGYGACLLNSGNFIKFHNKKFKDTLAHDRTSIENQHLLDLIPNTAKDKIHDLISNLENTKDRKSISFEIKTDNKSDGFIQLTFTKLVKYFDEIDLLMTVEDITRSKKRELEFIQSLSEAEDNRNEAIREKNDSISHFRKLLTESQIGYMRTDTLLKNVYEVNVVAQSILGYTTDNNDVPFEKAWFNDDLRLKIGRILKTSDPVVKKQISIERNGSGKIQIDVSVYRDSTNKYFDIIIQNLEQPTGLIESLQNKSLISRILELNYEPVLISDTDFNIRYANSKAQLFFHYGEEELLTKSMQDLISLSADKEQFEKMMANLKEDESKSLTIETLSNNGEARPIFINVTHYRDDEENILYYTIRDRKDYQSLKKAYSRELKKNQALFDQAGTMLILLDENGEIEQIGRKAGEILEMEPKTLFGLNWFDSFISARQKIDIQNFYAKISKNPELNEYSQYSLDTRLGSRKVIRWYISPLININGDIHGTLVNGNEITDLKESEMQSDLMIKTYELNFDRGVQQQLSNICSKIRDYIDSDIIGIAMDSLFIHHDDDINLNLTEINEKKYFTMIFGDQLQLLKNKEIGLFKRMISEFNSDNLDLDFPHQNSSYGSVWVHSSKDLFEFFVNGKTPKPFLSENLENIQSVAAIPIKQNDLKIGYIFLCDNREAQYKKRTIAFFEKFSCNLGQRILSWNQQMAQQLLDEKLPTKDREFNELINILSTDFKSSVISAKSFFDLIDIDIKKGNIDKLDYDMKLISKTLENINDFLDDISILYNQQELENYSSEIRVERVVKEAINLLSGKIDEKDIEIIIAPNLPKANGNRLDLLYIVQSLLDNAIKFIGESRKPRVEVGIIKKDKEDILYIRDNGIGIDIKDQQKIFNLFVKLDPYSAGSGLGLTLVSRIVESYGGKVWVDSEGKGTGTIFYFTLPQMQK